MTIEKQIQEKGLNAPRVTPDDIEANIVAAHYFTAAQGDAKAVEVAAFATGSIDNASGRPTPCELNLLTFCVLTLKNGFTVTGESACASPENFDAELGRTIARQNAKAKIWPLMGYELRTKLAAQAGDWKSRLLAEYRELADRLSKLEAYILDNPDFLELEEDDRNLLIMQSEAMSSYAGVLEFRLARADVQI